MKRFIHLLILLPLLLLGVNSLHAQRVDYTNDSGWDIGFGLGGSYQTSELRNFSGGGFTFTLGHSIYQKQDAFFALDWRFRFLGGQNTAFDDRITLDNTYQNVEYTHFNYDLEFVLTLDRLRQNTGIIFSGFGGAGVTHNMTSFDLLDNGIAYDYSTINPDGNASRYEINSDLEMLSDDDFETAGINHGCFTPTWGLYLGYQFTPHFSLGIEHKTNYFVEEGNSIIGADIDGVTDANTQPDKNHYTGLLFKWDIGYGTTPTPCSSPVVAFTVIESNSSYTTHQLNGTISNVNNPAYINIDVDGIPDDSFFFDISTKTLSSAYNLSPGNHVITITARNDCGQDSHSVEVFVEQPCYPPTVDFTVAESNNNKYTHILNANFTNIHSRSDVNLIVDGNVDNSYEFNYNSLNLNDFFNFAPGYHTITITARNECGRDSESVEVFIEAPCQIPTINVTLNESANPNYTHELRGSIANIKSKDNIKLLVDGVIDYSFQFESGTNVISNLYNFNPGTHTITIIVKNECGQDTEYLQAVVESPCELPIVEFSILESNNTSYTHQLSGFVHNISDRNNIKVYVDGMNDYSFNFNSNTGQIVSNYKFDPGIHTLTIAANNECGEDKETSQITIEKPCEIPNVTLSVNETNQTNYTHQLTSTVLNVENKNYITVFVDGMRDYSFTYNTSTHLLTNNYNFEPGTHVITVSAKNECGDDVESAQVIIDAPCQLPKVSFTISEVNNSNYTHKLSGKIINVTNASNITLAVNGIINNSIVFNPSTGTISSNIKLDPGIHIVSVIAKNECGEDSESIQVVVEDPCDPPIVDFKIIEIIHPSYSHELIGMVYNIENKSNISLLVDGRPDNSFKFNTTNGEISHKLKLSPGNHTITVKAKNECGDDVVSVQVYIESPCDPPVVKFNINEITHSTFTHEMNGTVSNIQNKSNITVLVDGAKNNSFQYIPSTNALSGKFNLGEGAHVITIIASNDCGQDSESATIIIETPCDPPVVDFQLVEIIHASYSHEMSGTITNVESESDVTILVNNEVNNSFQFVSSTNTLSGKINFEAGSHTISVIANNDCGQDTESVIVNVEIPCVPPVVEFELVEVINQAHNFKLNGTISNIENNSQITVTVDGNIDNDFIFNALTGVITSEYLFEPGNHTVVVVVENECGTDRETISTTVEEPCYPPKVNLSITESSNTNYTHTAVGSATNIDSKNQITFTIDGNEFDNFTFNTSTGKITANLNLEPGTHNITIQVQNDCGEDTYSTSITLQEPCIPPTVEFNINQASDGSETYNLTGSIENIENQNQIIFTVNGNTYNSFNYNASTGQITASFSFEPGTHAIKITVSNECGQDAYSEQVSVAVPCSPPKVNLSINETDNPNFTHLATGNATNIDSKNQITLKVDGNVVNDFSFDASTGQIVANLNLNAGAHTISVHVVNDCGEDTYSTSITVEEPCIPPTIVFDVAQSADGSENYNLTGTAENIENANQITITIDGNDLTNFNFIASTGKITASFSLEPGNHTIKVVVSNECGQDTEAKQISVESPCLPPKVNMTIIDSEDPNYTHTAKGIATNIDSKNQITIKLQGNIIEDFNFNANTGEIIAKLNLEPGNNSIRVEVTNDCGDDVYETTIDIEEPCEPPVINFNVTESEDNNFTNELAGTITNVNNKSDITVTIDDNVDNSFQFVPNTEAISGKYNLEPETHTITVKATNECGEDSESVNVTVEKPCTPPTIELSVKELQNSKHTHTINAEIKSIDSNEGITLTIDGNPFTEYTYNASSGKLSANIILEPGVHSVIITVENECGEDTDGEEVQVDEPCLAPVVNVSISESTANNTTHQINGTITNIDSKNKITLTVDGVQNTSFQFIPNSGNITGTFNLDPGTHNIKIFAENDCGQDSQTLQASVEDPCDPPSVSITVSESNNSSYTHVLSGNTTNINSKNELTITIDGSTFSGFTFNSGQINANLNLDPGSHSIKVVAKNDCGQDTDNASATVEDPCDPPSVSITVSESNNSNYTHVLSGNTTNISSKNEITITIGGNSYTAFQFLNGQISGSLNLDPGTHSIKVIVKNDCGQDTDNASATVEEPCDPPSVSISVSESSSSSYTHILSGNTTNIESKNEITLTIDGSVYNSFSFSGNQISANLNLDPGTHSIKIVVKNKCGQDTDTRSATVEEEACGPRINPGNAEWEFCLITPSGTYNRSDLDNDNFSYSGSASSLFFKATAGGGDATVSGQPYSISSGKYYHFSGNLQVTVSTSNPGSMGLWSVCIESQKAPQSGVGNSRPTSPCEDVDGDKNGDRDNDGDTEIKVNDRNNGRTNINSGRTNSNSGRTNTSTESEKDNNNTEVNVGGRNSSKGRTGGTNTSTSGRRN